MDLLTVERIGGLAGFGGLGSNIRSRGQVSLASLSEADKTTVEQLFKAHGLKPSSEAKVSAMRDGFCFQLSRTSHLGVLTIEVPEAAVPLSIAQCVKDEWA